MAHNESTKANDNFDGASQEGQYRLGVALHHLGEHERAIELLRACVAANEARIDWANELGNILNAQSRYGEAAEVFEQALAKAPRDVQLWTNLGATQERLGNFAASETAYKTAIELQPQSQEAYQLLSALYAGRNMELEAVRAYCAGYVMAPREATTPYLLGKAFYVLGRLEEAAEVYRSWKEAEPDNPVPAHLFASCASGGDFAPDKCSDDYVNLTFDEYAGHFESKLGQLDYRGPALLERMMQRRLGGEANLAVLDAGCGTGLCAPVLRSYARSLVGVDLSGAMLEIAGQRGLYDALHKAEIESFLREGAREPFDLIACMDTLIYFGALAGVFQKFAANLRPGGWLIFTTEICGQNDRTFQLNPTGRYSHSVSFLRQTMEDAGFDCLALEHEALRTELQIPVRGVIVLARRM